MRHFKKGLASFVKVCMHCCFSSDAEENNRPVKVCVDGELLTKTWQDLRVGDVIKVERNDAIPADLVLLGTSGFAGVSYVETKSLGIYARALRFS